MGFYDHKRKREGEVFVIASKEHFSDKWMVSLSGKVEAPMEVEEEFVEEIVEEVEEEVI